VLSENLATTNLAEAVASLRTQGVIVLPYSLTVEMLPLRQVAGAFQIGVTGPPGVYAISQSFDLVTWNKLVVLTNTLGTITVTDEIDPSAPQKFYEAFRL
jgi:hypothetical protein